MTNNEVLDLAGAAGVAAKAPSSSLQEAYADMLRRRAEREGLTRDEQPEEPKPVNKAVKKKAPAKKKTAAAKKKAPAKKKTAAAKKRLQRRKRIPRRRCPSSRFLHLMQQQSRAPRLPPKLHLSHRQVSPPRRPPQHWSSNQSPLPTRRRQTLFLLQTLPRQRPPPLQRRLRLHRLLPLERLLSEHHRRFQSNVSRRLRMPSSQQLRVGQFPRSSEQRRPQSPCLRRSRRSPSRVGLSPAHARVLTELRRQMRIRRFRPIQPPPPQMITDRSAQAARRFRRLLKGRAPCLLPASRFLHLLAHHVLRPVQISVPMVGADFVLAAAHVRRRPWRRPWRRTSPRWCRSSRRRS